MKKRMSFWDALAWLALIYILVWLILKVTGIINTSLWLEYSPIFGAVYIAGWQINKLENVSKEVSGLRIFRDETINKIHQIELNCSKNHK